MSINLAAVARVRVSDPMNTWPDHMRCHSCTLMGNFLFDYNCLRCHLEEEASRLATEQVGINPVNNEADQTKE